MPPKKAAVAIDGVDTTPLAKEKLEVLAVAIKEQNDKEREERNYFQVERNKIRTFWEITRQELEETQARVRNKDRQIEDERDKNYEELKACRQMITHLQFEQQRHLTDTKTEEMCCIKNAQHDYLLQERELLKDKTYMKKKLIDQLVAGQEQIKALKMLTSEELYDAEKRFQVRILETDLKFEKKFNFLKQELEVKQSVEMAAVEERKSTQVSELLNYQDSVFTEMKTYYNDITLNNLVLMKKLKEQMEAMRFQNERMANTVTTLTAQNHRLTGPLKQAHADAEEYEHRLANYTKDKLTLAHKTMLLQKTKKELSLLRWTFETLQLLFEKLVAEKEDLKRKLFQAVLEIEQKSSLKRELLYKQIEELRKKAENREVLICELDADLNKPHKGINTALKQLLDSKNQHIKDLEYELGRVYKAHNDMLDTYEEKLLQFGIPRSELGFKPLRFLPKHKETPSRVSTKSQCTIRN